ncbi:energy transducer TonB [Lewinella sp. IMCC34183]|uniref:energy transducer TonB n=1 Tax=Lewinella sp. IMCC34183 TaxID=2248762 RepID=UPI000E234EDC|nr:energy transducer TonB [Lewinella sp. IMCC34183]
MLSFTFSGTTVVLAIGGLCLLTACAVFLLRRHLHARPATAGAARDVLRDSPAIHRYSLCAALLLAFLTINWTEYGAATVYAPGPVLLDEIMQEIPITRRDPPPPPPPPPPPVIEPVPDDQAPAVQQQDRSVTEEEPVHFEEPRILQRSERPAPPPPPPAPPPPVIDDALPFVERMPVFGEDCPQLSGAERKACSDRALLSFVQQRVKYPALARENRVEGTVVIRFIVEKDGSVSGIEAVREVPAGCTEASLRAIREINASGRKFTPGLQAGRPVRVIFNLPVKFKLD